MTYALKNNYFVSHYHLQETSLMLQTAGLMPTNISTWFMTEDAILQSGQILVYVCARVEGGLDKSI